jgi:uncharacterized protein (TIGR00251 family)
MSSPPVNAGLPAGHCERPILKILQVKVKPNARASVLVAQHDGTWLAQVAAPPVEGQANEALVALVAKHFGVRRTQVRIKSGASGRMKLVQVDD